jgi:uncharacterized protein YfcZ (UPF0381/DUF406 family)
LAEEKRLAEEARLAEEMQPMSQEEFQAALQQLKAASFDPKRLEILQFMMTQQVYLSSLQARQILESFTFDPKKIEALVLIKDRILDIDGAFLVLEAFTFDAQRRRASEMLSTLKKKERQAESTRRRQQIQEEIEAMPDDLFNVLKQKIQSESFDQGRLSLVNLAVQNSYFSALQVKLLLEQWSFDPARLEAFILLAPRITNLEQGFLITEAFVFDANKTKVRTHLSRIRR